MKCLAITFVMYVTNVIRYMTIYSYLHPNSGTCVSCRHKQHGHTFLALQRALLMLLRCLKIAELKI